MSKLYIKVCPSKDEAYLFPCDNLHYVKWSGSIQNLLKTHSSLLILGGIDQNSTVTNAILVELVDSGRDGDAPVKTCIVTPCGSRVFTLSDEGGTVDAFKTYKVKN